MIEPWQTHENYWLKNEGFSSNIYGGCSYTCTDDILFKMKMLSYLEVAYISATWNILKWKKNVWINCIYIAWPRNKGLRVHSRQFFSPFSINRENKNCKFMWCRHDDIKLYIVVKIKKGYAWRRSSIGYVFVFLDLSSRCRRPACPQVFSSGGTCTLYLHFWGYIQMFGVKCTL
jgi:hypothetical protein